MKKLIRKGIVSVIISSFILVMFACGSGGKSTDAPAASSKEITSFVFRQADNAALPVDIVGEIIGTDISVELPYGASVNPLIPTIAITGASISPGSGQQKNFTNPVTYNVTAADGSTSVYTVTVTTNSSKSIISFVFRAADNSSVFNSDLVCAINQTTGEITATVPFGTDVSNLMPNITITGMGVSPDTGVRENFSASVPYTVTAGDLITTKDYTVTITIAPSDAKDITNFNVIYKRLKGSECGGEKESACDIDEGNRKISCVAPSDVCNLGGMVTVKKITGTSVIPDDKTLVNFTDSILHPVTYTVTAADTSTKGYSVTIYTYDYAQKNITGFSFLAADNSGKLEADSVGVDNGAGTISVTVPYSTILDDLKPAISFEGVNVSPASQAPQDFSGDVQYTVTDKLGKTKVYTVTVTKAPPSNNASLDHVVYTPGGTVSPPIGAIDVDVSSVTVAVFPSESHATITLNGAPIDPYVTSSPLPLVNGNSFFILKITAQDGITQTTTNLYFYRTSWTDARYLPSRPISESFDSYTLGGGFPDGINWSHADHAVLACVCPNWLL